MNNYFLSISLEPTCIQGIVIHAVSLEPTFFLNCFLYYVPYSSFVHEQINEIGGLMDKEIYGIMDSTLGRRKEINMFFHSILSLHI